MIGIWSDDHAEQLPPSIGQRVSDFKAKQSFELENASSDASSARKLTVLLTAFGHEVTFLLADSQEPIRSRAERALKHLQWLIVANPSEQGVWTEAFNINETACEKLGGAHMLLHGIYAFKAHATGGRTDLIFQEPSDDRFAAAATEGLVLTEWKIARRPNDVAKRYKEAFEQAKSYTDGPLTGVELKAYRYLVVVTEKRVQAIPDDFVVAHVTYRHINIAVNPATPSQQAKITVAAK